jgi:hypothetical protein
VRFGVTLVGGICLRYPPVNGGTTTGTVPRPHFSSGATISRCGLAGCHSKDLNNRRPFNRPQIARTRIIYHR